jgi:hypothetical protein
MMKPRTVLRLYFAGLTLAVAAPVAAAPDYYGAIRPLMVDACLGCHSASGVSFSLEDAETAYAMGPALAAAVAARRMPPWLAEPGHQSYIDDASLDPQQMQLFADWAAADFPRGEPRPDPEATASTAAFTPDLSLEVLAGDAYLPNQARKDDYRCFLIEWPLEQAAYVTGFRARPGNRRVAHHLVLMAVEPQYAQRFRDLDAAEDGHGYQCFGGGVPDRLGEPAVREAYEATYPDGVRELNRGHFWLAHWAPGMDGYHFPAGTGLRIEPGAVLIAQMHYYAAFAPGESDEGSRMEFTLADTVERPAVNFPLTDYRWLESRKNQTMVIAPGASADFEVSESLGRLLNYFARLTKVPADEIEGMELHSANLHMHAYGASGAIVLTEGEGPEQTLLSVPRWDLAWQRDFTFGSPKVFPREQLDATRLGVRCTFSNPTDEPVYGGYGSDEEMCFNFSYIAMRRKPATTEVEAIGGGSAATSR